MAAMAGLALIGGALSAAGTIMGGNAAAAMGQAQQRAMQFQAEQDKMNSAADIASAQRKSLDQRLQTDLLTSRAVASAAAGGVTTTSGSPLDTQAQIHSRGQYAADLDLWNGENAATGDLNKAAAAEYTGRLDKMGGDLAQQASYFSAAGSLASSGASAYKMYGMAGGNLPGFPSAGASVGYGGYSSLD